MKKVVLVAIMMILISANLYAKYPKEQLVLLQDLCTIYPSVMEDNGKFAWVSPTQNGNKEIFYYDGLQTQQLTFSNNQGNKTIMDFTNGEIFYQDIWYDYDNGSTQISDLFLYKDGNLIKLCDNSQFISYAGYRYGNRICWVAGPYGSSTDNEIYLYDNGIISRITNNDYLERYPKLNNDYLVWVAAGSLDVENKYFIYKDGNTTELPVDILGYYYLLSDKGIIWQGCDGGPNCHETPNDLDHEIFFYDFDKVTQITDTPDKIERGYMATNDFIYVLSSNEDRTEPVLSIFDYQGEKLFEYQIPGLNSLALGLKDDKAIFRAGDTKNLYYFDGSSLQIIDSGHDFNYGFAFDGVGYSYKDDQGNYATYLYKNGSKELIFDAINVSPRFYDDYLVFTYPYPNMPLYKLVYLDPNLPYIQITGNESTKLQKGDTLKLSLTVKNPGPNQAVDIYIIEISGDYPFQMFRFLNPEGFKFQLYGYTNIMLPKDLDLSFQFYSAKIGDIPDAPLNKVSYIVIPTHAGTFIPLTAFPSTLSYELAK
jgi:hypothetical protein